MPLQMKTDIRMKLIDMPRVQIIARTIPPETTNMGLVVSISSINLSTPLFNVPFFSASKNDPEFLQLISHYHRQTTNTATIAKLLCAERGIKTRQYEVHLGFIISDIFSISPRNIARRLVVLGLGAGAKTERNVPPGIVNQLIIDQLDRDPTRRSGPATIKQEIARKTGVHVFRCRICAPLHSLHLIHPQTYHKGANGRSGSGSRTPPRTNRS